MDIWRTRLIFVVVVGAFSLFWLTENEPDPDLWGHVRFGLDILEEGALPRTDSFSYTAAGDRWINHEWLSELAFGALYRAFGPSGLLLLDLLGAAIIGMAVTALYRARGIPVEYRVILACLIVSVLSYGLSFRPQLFSYLLFGVLILTLLHGRPVVRAVVPLIFLLWVNLHGGFLMGLAALCVFCTWGLVSCLIQRRRAAAAGYVALGVASWAVTLVNPYGFGLWRFLVGSLSQSRPYLAEWESVQVLGTAFPDFVALTLVCGAVVVAARKTRAHWLTVLAAIVGIAAYRNNRHAPFFALCAAFLLWRCLGEAFDRVRRPFAERLAAIRPRLFWLYPAIGLVIVAVIPLYRGRSPWRVLVRHDRYPVRAVEWLKKNDVTGNCVVFFDWGEYVIWHLAGRVRVSLDGRYRTVYSDEVIRQNFALFYGHPAGAHLLEKFPADIILLHALNPGVVGFERNRNWRLVFSSPTEALFLRSDYPGLTGMQPAFVETDDTPCTATLFP